MPIVEALLPEYDHEMATTRRLLDRVPEADFGWQPHPRSYSLGLLASHLVHIPMWCNAVLDMTVLELETLADEAKPRQPASRADLLRAFDRRVAGARARLAGSTDAELLGPWTLKKGGHEIFTLPRVSAIRTFVMNHSIHHRGQLSVYLRLRDVPVPAMYGPTADDQ